MAAYGRQPESGACQHVDARGCGEPVRFPDRLSGCSAGQPAGGSRVQRHGCGKLRRWIRLVRTSCVHAVDGRVARIPAVGCGHVHVGRVHPLAARSEDPSHRGDSRHGSHRDTARLAVLGALGTWFDCHGGGAGIGVLRHGHATDARVRPGGGADIQQRAVPASSPRSACTSLSAC